ncbi:Re/Si-specific NAD(P)(+) transhydrogenase subunit alpha [Hyalangium versicolor]|uniref:Re/Si-specific NAD(P)(+) transhydrogenase subunit alpha n=1 Tax=Hyalangium versicolor TaxID=2861190 RepID=UPI001CCB63DB|nr:Re/Si-specific NAD(P)(+) transhydrogenase subunit alpha [Hyalangium versicolor]
MPLFAAIFRAPLAKEAAIRIGVPREILPGERRVAATPESIRKLRELGFEVSVEKGAGSDSGISDDAYAAAGATLADTADALWKAADVVVKVRPPTPEEASRARPGITLISLLQPERHPELPPVLQSLKLSAIALERIPRVTRAQKMDVLSSMANLAGYRAVIEAAQHYQGFFSPQITAAGATPPARVLIIGAGVAGLAAIAAAKSLGAEVRAFDVRAAAREQVESLGARFLQVDIQESGEGGGGYAKTMSKEFIDAEMALFRQQAAEVDIIITTALVPGTRAPILLPRDVVDKLKPGSIVVDMAAEQGGNCELCKPGEIVEFNGVKIIGFTDLASRMAGTASRFFANNLVHLITEMGAGDKFHVDLENDVVRPALITHGGELLPPPPRKEPSPAAPAKPAPKPPPADAKPQQQAIMAPSRRAWGTTIGGLLVIGVLFVLGRFAPEDFLKHFTVFILACFVGWQVIWSVTPALHTPLMSVTNAISGIIIIGGMLQIGSDVDLASILGALAVLVAAINISGGFLVTQRMLKMFRKNPGGGA